MKKKFIAILLCMTVAVSVAAGCGTKEPEVDNSTKTSDTKEETKDVEPVEERKVYVTPEWLRSAMDGNQEGYEDLVIAEVGYGDVKKSASYKEGHIEGALYVDICEVEDATGSEEGAYNILSAEEIEKNLLSHGITKDTKVVLYDKSASAGVARVAYGYLWAGVEDVKILNGGLDGWKKAGYEAADTKVNEAEAAKDFGVEVPAHPEYWLSVEDAKDKLEEDDNFKLVSIRSKDEWLGKTSGYNYMDKAGEPKGAVWGKASESSADVNGVMNEDGTVKNLDELMEVWSDVDFTLDNELSFYCGTGWRACIPFLILYENGYDTMSVFDGGWYEWLMHDDYPVQVGDPATNEVEYTTVGELPTGKAAK